MGDLLSKWLFDLRSDGWMVAVHNDYRMAGEFYTFWLFTHPDGRWVKGEGHDDTEALANVRGRLRALAAIAKDSTP